jgi:protein-disulfide isomerase
VEHKSGQTWRVRFDVLSTVVMISLAAAVVWQGRVRSSASSVAARAESVREPVPIPSDRIPISDGATRGATTASVALIEYADFECPYCAKFAQDVESALQTEYIDTGRLLLVFKHLPLPKHQYAPAAAQAAWCAGRQSKFWEMHARLFSLGGHLGGDGYSLEAVGSDLGLDVAAYSACRNGADSRQAVEVNRAEGERLKISGTPTFLLGRIGPDRSVQVSHVLRGAKPIEAFRTTLRELF